MSQPANQQHPASNVANPDDRLLPPPSENPNFNRSSGTGPRKILNPDDRLLPTPPPGSYEEDHKDIRVVGKAFGQRVSAEAHELAQKAKQVEKKVEGKVGQVCQWIRHDWIHLGVAVAVIGLALHSFRK